MIEEQSAQMGDPQPVQENRRWPELADDGHYLILVYTFFHHVEGEQRERLLERANDRWQHWLYRLLPGQKRHPVDYAKAKMPEREDFAHALDDSYFFLPHVRTLLLPETELFEPQSDGWKEAEAMANSLEASHDRIVDLISAKAQPDQARKRAIATAFDAGVLRLTLRTTILETYNKLTLVTKAPTGRDRHPWEKEQIPFEILWADAFLFPQRVGFLALKVRVSAGDIDELRWFWGNTWAIFPPRLPEESPEQLIPPYLRQSHPTSDAAGMPFHWRSFVEFLINEFVHQEHSETYAPPAEPASVALTYTSQPDAQVYGSNFRLFGFVTAVAGYPWFDENSSSTPPFATRGEQILFELSTGEDSENPDWRPSFKQLDSLRETALVSYWHGWQALVMWGNCCFLAEDSNFVRNVMQFSVESDYFYLYLLTLFQEERLRHLAGEIVRKGEDIVENLAETEILSRQLLTFRNRYWFQEVSPKPGGTHLYRVLQNAFDLENISRSVSEELDALYKYFEAKAQKAELERREKQHERERRREQTLTVLGGAAAGSAWVLTATGTNQSWQEAIKLAIGFALVGIGLGILSQRFISGGLDTSPYSWTKLLPDLLARRSTGVVLIAVGLLVAFILRT